jgi:hypothetical protein
MARAELFIGIDPGVETGYAVWSRSAGRFTELQTLSFWEAYDRITSFPTDGVEVFIENPDSKRAMYVRTEAVEFQRQRERVAKNIGSNRREASLLIERLIALGYRVTAVSPTKEAKWNAQIFKRLTNYQGRTSQHTRDAGRLVFGM